MYIMTYVLSNMEITELVNIPSSLQIFLWQLTSSFGFEFGFRSFNLMATCSFSGRGRKQLLPIIVLHATHDFCRILDVKG